MTFTYTRDIPNAPNNPSQDQPDMKINTNSTDDLVAVDHTSFNVANGGQHKSIHFNQDASYVPVPPVSPPQLFTNTVSGIPQIFYYSGTAPQSSDQYDIAATFSTFLFGGMILKGGLITKTNPVSQVFTYTTLTPPIESFINNTLAVVLTPITGSGSFSVSAVSSTTFTVTGAGIGTYYFIAVGY